ncbi:MAG: bifunctional phosphopantothenoylcysteine decarboxylase/phosphopantothenate--cysteine ligase CoaBC [Chloroflexi bacterium]|nr:bifunctional phosphopantothenoylcysteine decarboxylase/phosphopantothenate--cysteine ligase CoaBC [Chloroflexota bacterium]
MSLLENKYIVLGVTGSVAAYKAVDLASKLTQAGAVVDVIMTASAQRFVAPITFESVTGRPVYSDMWQTDHTDDLPTPIVHIGLGEEADLFVVAPVTANMIAKLAAGLADDLLSLTAISARCPTVIAPAMDGGMYQHPATQANLATLRSRGVTVIEPEVGRFASGMTGKGRFPATPTLIGNIRQAIGRNGALAGTTIVVTAGGTREPLDPVRYLTNYASGKQGHALAQAAVDVGADVILISTTEVLPVPVGAQCVLVDSARDMLAAVQRHLAGADALLMASAVADFRPAEVKAQKIKKSATPEEELTVVLTRNPDILLDVKQQRAESGWPRVVVGFAAESENLLENAQAKLVKKGVDMMVANDITAPDAGFQADTNRVIILSADGSQEPLELASKATISELIIQRVATMLHGLPGS